jgi:hypothetical protein
MIIPVDFTPEFFEWVRQSVIQNGQEKVRDYMLEQGEHPRFVEVIIRRAVRSCVAR